MSLNGLTGAATTTTSAPATNTTAATTPAVAAINWGLAGTDTPVGAVAVTSSPAKAASPITTGAPAAATGGDPAVAAIEGKMAGLEVKTAVAPLDEEDPAVTVKISGIRKDAGLGRHIGTLSIIRASVSI
jgi:hypothetical protein